MKEACLTLTHLHRDPRIEWNHGDENGQTGEHSHTEQLPEEVNGQQDLRSLQFSTPLLTCRGADQKSMTKVLMSWKRWISTDIKLTISPVVLFLRAKFDSLKVLA